MKNRKIILGAMVLSVPVATAITAISMSINHNNNELNSANSKYAIDSSKLYATDSSIEALNPDTIVTFGQRQSFSRSEYWTLWTNIYNNLKTNYYYINEVKKFVTNSTYEHISKYFTTPKLIQELNQLVKGINHVDKFQSKRQWFSMKTPSNSVALERGEGITTPVNTFTPLVAEFDSRTLGVFKVRIDTLGSSGLQLKNGTQHLSLYLHNDAAQFNSNKSITDLINSHDIFLRDEERNSPFNKIESADFISVKRSGTKIQVFLKMKPNDQVKLMVDSVDSKTSSAAIKGGFLNSSESNFGVNMTNPPSFDPIGIYSYAGNYSKKQINFSLAPGKTTKTNIPVYFKGVKNDENLVFSLPERGNLAITPKKLNVEKSIINPTNDDSITKGDNPLNVETSSDGNNVFVNINFGADGDIYSKTESSKNKIQFENLGVQPWQKIFFENIVNMKNAKNETRKIDFVSYSDPDSESKRILAEIFSQWLQVDDKHISPFPGQTKDLSFNMYNITHNNYSKIKISEEPTVLKNMDGVNIIKKIKEQEKLVNDIYAKTGFNKYIPKNDLFSPATDYGMVLKNMYPWLYAYSDNYKTTISNLTKLIELNKENLNNADVKKKLNNEAEGIILNLVQRRIDAYLNNFKRVMLQRIYEYFGKALKLNATKGDQIIAKDAFVEKTVLSPDKQNVNGIVFKNNLKLVPVDKKTSSSYLQSVINRILNMIKTYHFDNYLVENIVDFQNNISKITNPDTYLDKTKDLSHPYMTSDFSKCINCYRCVRACDEV
ncbi:MAG: hypothetical protein HRT99_03805, partial [Mycoplasmatales bacterium]|nr:hypothetical protein [Mycoplasmatales bacterium]